MNAVKNIIQYPNRLPNTRQNGYVLVLVTVFLMVLAGSTIQFFNRTAENTIVSGTYRDNSAALIAAEAAMDFLYTSFINGLDTTTGCSPDSVCAARVPDNLADPSGVMLMYGYYVGDGSVLAEPDRLTASQPSILQNIATGEAHNTPAENPTKPNIPNKPLRISDLFISNARHPVVFGMDSDSGILTPISSTDWPTVWDKPASAPEWSGTSPGMRSAAWLEFTLNPKNSNSVDIYIQAVAKVGNLKSYTQKYVGSFLSGTVLGNLPVLAEANNS